MKLLDVNVVLPAHRADHPDHATTRAWLDALLSSGNQFGVPWTVWWSFLRLSSHPRVFPVPTPAAEAFEFIAALRAQPGHIPVEPGDQHLDCLRRVCAGGEASADLLPDAVLAALAVEHGGEVVSFDRDFARFPRLRWSRPEQ
ncbi:MAG TPA: type II toxin-antitoxin system VapC family toxin [Candidatus Dormibacteraeota bacterium]|nr:type II toxin-antitoxin system VapC family toxin [Candidatus Dormibacteraeota bacterium]